MRFFCVRRQHTKSCHTAFSTLGFKFCTATACGLRELILCAELITWLSVARLLRISVPTHINKEFVFIECGSVHGVWVHSDLNSRRLLCKHRWANFWAAFEWSLFVCFSARKLPMRRAACKLILHSLCSFELLWHSLVLCGMRSDSIIPMRFAIYSLICCSFIWAHLDE